jgi:predicted Fe-Mo cluster-binding NifX family protein
MTTAANKKIAAVTDDGKTISQHFGRAQYYLVVTFEDGQITSREMRDKLGHVHFASEPHEAEHHNQPHGFSAAEHDRHLRMASPIADCEALLARGMGSGAYQSLQAIGIRPIVTDIADIEEAAVAYVEERITNYLDRLH